MADAAPGAGDPEPYQALYRRYRPQAFAQVRGQEHVTRALRNAVRESRVAHAYLFSGPRGTGKTSTARILAMALNCESPLDGEPDGACASCLSIRAGSSLDVFELDAASNRKLEEMRDLLSRVALGNPGRWKVYIIDEVHQLTNDSASALLKTLEEPPGHVVFVLATTDPQKVLPTIKSRAQHFEFRLLDGGQLTGLLTDINQDAGLGLDEASVALAVQRARGSARDAESALEQLAALGGQDKDPGQVPEVAQALAGRDAPGALQALADAVNRGHEPRRLANDLVEHLREAFLCQLAPSLSLAPEASKDELSALAKQMGLPFLVRCMEVVGQTLVEMRDAVDPRVTLEVALVRLASPAADTSVAAILERVERLEKAVAGAGGAPSPAGTGVPEPAQAAGRAEQSAPPLLDASLAPAPAGPPPPAGPAQARVALGAFLKGNARPGAQPAASSAPGRALPDGPPPLASTPPPATTGPTTVAGQGQAQPDASSPAHTAATGAPPSAGIAGSPSRASSGTQSSPSGPGAGTAGSPSGPSVGTQGPPSGPSTAPAGSPLGQGHNQGPGPSQTRDMPSRDELTKAWGDHVVEKLPQAAKVFMAAGHFLQGGEQGAIFALPDPGLLSRAAPFKPEAERALAAYFGRPIALQLVLDRSAPPVGGTSAAPEDEPYDLGVFDDATDADLEPAISPEQRLMQAFPGAVLEN